MSRLASIVLRVTDLNCSVAFYADTLGFTIDRREPLAATIQPKMGPMLLLASQELSDLTGWAETAHEVAVPGKRIYMGGGTPELRDQLQSKGTPVEWIEREWGQTTLLVTDPDGHIVHMGGGMRMSDEEMLNWYDRAPGRLEEALAGLTEEDLDLTRAPGKWSIRQLVLHIVDSDCTSLSRPKFALAEPGRPYTGNAYDPDVWAEGLDYAHRPIAAEVALFKAIRAHMGGLLRHLPGALDRSTTMANGQPYPVRSAIHALTIHALHHIEQIRETRAVHGK